MAELPEGWDLYDPNQHERSDNPGYKRARAVASERAHRRRSAYGEALRAVRRARELTQAAVAERLGVAQPEVSRIEHQVDLLLSTLSDYIGAVGGELTLGARFGDGITVELGPTISDPGEQPAAQEFFVVPDPARVAALSYLIGGLPAKEERFYEVATR